MKDDAMDTSPTRLRVLLSNLPDDESAARIARTMLEERLVACVNLLAPCRSFYRWEGAVQDDAERPALFKTEARLVDAAMARLVELHPYEVPEVLVLDPAGGHAAYLAWVAAEVAPAAGM